MLQTCNKSWIITIDNIIERHIADSVSKLLNKNLGFGLGYPNPKKSQHKQDANEPYSTHKPQKFGNLYQKISTIFNDFWDKFKIQSIKHVVDKPSQKVWTFPPKNPLLLGFLGPSIEWVFKLLCPRVCKWSKWSFMLMLTSYGLSLIWKVKNSRPFCVLSSIVTLFF